MQVFFSGKGESILPWGFCQAYTVLSNLFTNPLPQLVRGVSRTTWRVAMANRSVSIYDIARLAGGSTATVSNVLNDKGRVGEATRKRVLQVAQEEGYVPNLAAKSLREARSRMVGIVTPDISNYFYSSLALKIETFFRDKGYACVITNSHRSEKLAEDAVRNLLQRQVDGLVFVGGSSDQDLNELTGEVPTVYIDHRFADEGHARLMVDNDVKAIIQDCLGILAAHGCSHVVTLTVSAADLRATGRTLRVLTDPASSHIEPSPFDDVALLGPHDQPSSIESEQLVGDFLDAGNELDGIIAIGDRLALGSVNALRTRGLSVGSDVKVIGFDNSLLAQVASPTISSVERNVGQLALRGSAALLEMLEGDEQKTGRIIIPHQIVERESTLGA